MKETSNLFQASRKLRLIRKIYSCSAFVVDGGMQPSRHKKARRCLPVLEICQKKGFIGVNPLHPAISSSSRSCGALVSLEDRETDSLFRIHRKMTAIYAWNHIQVPNFTQINPVKYKMPDQIPLSSNIIGDDFTTVNYKAYYWDKIVIFPFTSLCKYIYMLYYEIY